LTYHFNNGYLIKETKAELQNHVFYGKRKEHSENKKREIVAFHLNNNFYQELVGAKSFNN
jgi:hypothetical protein